MKKQIEKLIIEVQLEIEKEDSYAYLPEILESLQRMKESLLLSRDRRSRMAGALGRIVMENYSFSESDLGNKIIQLANEFADF